MKYDYDSLPSHTDVTKLLYGGRKLPSSQGYQTLEPQALKLLARVPKTSPHYILVAYILHYAQMRRCDAGYGGCSHDNGASRLEDQVEVFISAMIERKIPDMWNEYAKMLEKNADPEYLEYLRLQQKFGDK